MIKKIWVTVLLSAAFSTAAMAAPWVTMKITYNYNTYDYSAEAVYLNINGKQLNDLPMEPIILNGTTMVPVREVCEAFGAVVDWNKNTEEIYIAYGDSIVVLKVNSTEANVNGTSKTLSVPARIINNKTMIPIRFVSEAFDKQVDWVNDERTIYIKDKVSEETTQTPAENETQTEAQTVLNETETQETTSAVEDTSAVSEQTQNVFNQNIMFDAVNKTLILKNSNTSFNAEDSSITYSNDDKTMSVQFNGTVGTSIAQGTYSIDSDGIIDVSYYESDGNMLLTFNCESKLTAKIESDKTYVYVTLQ